MEINVEFDKEDFGNKMNSLKNEFRQGGDSFYKFKNLLKNVIEKLNKSNDKNYFDNLEDNNNL